MTERTASRIWVFALGALSGALLGPLLLSGRPAIGSRPRRKSPASKSRRRARPKPAAVGSGPAGLVKPPRPVRTREPRSVDRLS